MEQPLKALFSHPIVAFALIAAIVSALRSVAAKAQREGTARGYAPRAARSAREDESELETRVRKNFEEMMRRRGETAPKAALQSQAMPTPAPKKKRRPRIDYDERAHAEPKSTEGPRKAAAVVRPPEGSRSAADRRAAARKTASAAATHFIANARTHSQRRAAALPRLKLDRANLRLAVLQREILDPPVALRG